MDQQNSNSSVADQEVESPSVPQHIETSEQDHHKHAKFILVIIFIILIAIIVVLSVFLVNETSQIDEVATESAPLVQEESASVDEVSNERIGLSTYINADYEIEFDYPEEWGAVTAAAGRETDHLTSGSEIEISFSGNSSVVAGFKTTDWVHDPLIGHGGSAYPGVVSFTQAKQAKEYIDVEAIYLDNNEGFGYVEKCLEFCTTDHPKTVVKYSFKVDSEKVEVIEFYYYGDVFDLEYTDKVSVWDNDAIEAASITELLPNTDFRVITLENIGKSINK